MSRWWFASALALTVAASAFVRGQDDIARTLKTQTQGAVHAVNAGNPRVWDKYLDANVIYLAEDGTRKTKMDLLKEIFLRSPQGRVTGFVDRREGRDVPWSKRP